MEFIINTKPINLYKAFIQFNNYFTIYIVDDDFKFCRNRKEYQLLILKSFQMSQS
jgi:hypothetical protein